MVETQEGIIGFVYSFNIFVPHKLRALLSLNTLTLISVILYINQFETVTPPSLGNPQTFEVLKIGLLKFPPPDPWLCSNAPPRCPIWSSIPFVIGWISNYDFLINTFSWATSSQKWTFYLFVTSSQLHSFKLQSINNCHKQQKGSISIK